MQKFIIVKIFLVITLVFSFKNIEAVSSTKTFGTNPNMGIISTKAFEIRALENLGYKCIVPGKTIQIAPAEPDMPSAYFIPYKTLIKPGVFRLKNKQQVLGTYESVMKAKIQCIHPTLGNKTVLLPKAVIFGNSRK